MLATGQMTKFRDKYEPFWAVDPEEKAHLRDNQEIPKDFPDYVMTASKQGYYADDLLLSALSDRLKTPIVIFAWIPARQSWERSVVCSQFHEDDHAVVFKDKPGPIVMMQQDCHYISLCQEGDSDSVPEAWLKKTLVKPRQFYRGGGSDAPFGSPEKQLSLPSTPDKSSPGILSLPDSPGNSAALSLPASSSFAKLSLLASAFPHSSIPASLDGIAGSAGVTVSRRRLHGKQQVFSEDPQGKRNDWVYPLPAVVSSTSSGQRQEPTWTCPVCGFETFCVSGKYSSYRISHFRSARPEIPKHIYAPGKTPEPVASSASLPQDQRDWSCPLCSHGLPFLAPAERLRAIRKHVQQCHPKETVRSLVYKQQIGRPAPATFGQKMTERVLAARRVMYPTHDVVFFMESLRGLPRRSFACKTCLSLLKCAKATAKTDVSCHERVQELQTNGFVRSRKRTWWNNLNKRAPHAAEEFLKNAGLSRVWVEQILGVGQTTDSTTRWTKILALRGKNKKLQKSSKRPKGATTGQRKRKSLAKPRGGKVAQQKQGSVNKKHLKGAQAVRVGEAKNPGPTANSLKVITFNCQGGAGAWRYLNLASQDVDVACLQEVAFTKSQAKGFIKAARAKGFNFYFQEGCVGADARNVGGVGILARRCLPQRFGCQNGDEFAQTMFIWVNGILFGSIYAHPKESSPAQASGFFLEAMAQLSVQQSACWCVGGDFNEIPQQSQFVEVARAVNGTCVHSNQPTRWVGPRELDYFLTNRPDLCANVGLPDLKLSDHRIVAMTLHVPVLAPTTASLLKGPKLVKPDNISADVWRQALEEGWLSATRTVDLSVNAMAGLSVQEHWDSIQTALRHAFRHAFDSVAPAPRQLRHLDRKGSIGQVQWSSQAIRGPRPQNGHMRDRKQRRQLARWYELRRLLTKEALTVAQETEARQLQQKLGLQNRPSLAQVHRTIGSLDLELQCKEDSSRKKALDTWRQNMQSVKHLSAWIRSKDDSTVCNVVMDDQIAETVVEGASMIHKYWTQFWARLDHDRNSVEQRCEALLAGFPHYDQFPWTAPTGTQLLAAAQGAKGVGSTDGWSADEFKYLPLTAFDRVSEFFQKAVALEELPCQFKQARMVCLPKSSKIKQFQVHPKDCRPITIMSSWWRLWVSTICKSQDMKAWLQRTLDPAVAGLETGDIYNCLIKIFDEFDERGYILGLDYEKAYDCLDPAVTRHLLVRYGWPPSLASSLCSVWAGQRRFVSWGHHVHPDPLLASAQPQGDPLGCVIMSLWVLAGVRSVRTEGSWMSTYLDDRCVAAASHSLLFEMFESWVAWSRQVGLLESVSKTVAVGRRAAEKRKLLRVFPADAVGSWVRVLGACSFNGVRGLSEVETARIDSACRVASLLQAVRFPLPSLLTFARLFAVSRANFGWVCRSPTWAVSKRLFSACWGRSARFSCPWVRCLLLGGNCHLDVTWCTRLVGSLLGGSYVPRWSLRPGTVAFCLHRWLLDRGWSLLRPWVWSHAFGQVTLDLSPPRPSPSLIPGLTSISQHNVRQGWRAWCFLKWANSGRHEIRDLSFDSNTFCQLDFTSIRQWALHAAPAATVALGATFSPALWENRRPEISGCPWCKHELGHWRHICWECEQRPSNLPMPHAWLARFGWSFIGDDPEVVQAVRCWMVQCQQAIWTQTHGSPDAPAFDDFG